jgi:RHS repeat-associated protein
MIGSHGETLIKRGYVYDNSSNLVRVTDSRWGETIYVYDSVEHLIKAMRDRGPGEIFSYDFVGNVTSMSEQGTGDQLLEYGLGGRLVRRGNTTYVYDDNGRLTEKSETDGNRKHSTWTYTWDASDRLRAVTTPQGVTWKYEYDPFGRRVRKRGPDGDSRFVWDGNVVAHYLEEDEVRSTWLFDPKTFRPLGTIQNGLFYSIMTDQIGTPREIVDRHGRVAWSAVYSSWGKVSHLETRGVECPIRFQGQWFDEESGLHYNRFRYYDPHSARFVSADPIRLLGGPNLYRYAHNPINWVDPLGLGDFGCDSPDIQPLKEQFEQGTDPTRIVPDDYIVVRGGQGETPPPGTTFSGSTGATVEQAATGVPHGSIRATTAGEIRTQGGTVEFAPEPTRGGNTNWRHVNVTEGGAQTVFPAQAQNNPAPKSQRVQ